MTPAVAVIVVFTKEFCDEDIVIVGAEEDKKLAEAGEMEAVETNLSIESVSLLFSG